MYERVCACVCVCERERERERENLTICLFFSETSEPSNLQILQYMKLYSRNFVIHTIYIFASFIAHARKRKQKKKRHVKCNVGLS